ncbi:MAG: aminomethyl-transferring glycine dehydrogenase subunit GcvPA [Thaumarchaeota archaeon]|nr:aminomethyl-transferring glycine dehydrogenase subunit GcvPA [Nitrososphaerota archaeon]
MPEPQARHPFLPNLDPALVSEMLKKSGAESVEDLFSDIPSGVRLNRSLRIPEATSEYGMRREMGERLSRNKSYPGALCFLGGGVWPHYIPAVVESVTARQEFYTSYTPYQAEVSQGMLQALFEYQSLMSDLLSMEACNSSLYDWASAAGEAARMARRVTGRKKLLVAGNAGPQRLGVIQTYAEPTGMVLEKVAFDKSSGRLDMDDLRSKVSADVAGVYLENPNYFGVIEEDAGEAVSVAHKAGALAIAGVDPISLSLLKPPGEYEADIAVGEGQPLGIPMNYGGPHLGLFSVRDMNLARSTPGRLIGITSSVADPSRKAFAMVLQTREQHIRREGATSNICTNQSLMAVAAACYLSLLGKTGFRELGESVIANSHYAAKRISKVPGATSPHFSGSFFKEFVVSYSKRRAADVHRRLAEMNVLGGYPVSEEFGLRAEAGSFCVTEVHTSSDIEKLAVALEEVL